MIKAVIFDMDGLLIDTEPYWQETERKIFSGLGINITREMQKETFGLRTDEQIRHWYNYSPWKNPDFKKIENEYDSIMLDYFKTKAELMDGTEYIFDFFRKRNIRRALASSSSMVLISSFLERFGLRDFFEVVYSAENETFGKPHPAVYISTAGLLDEHPSSCLAFEDSFNGLLSAKSARMKAVVVPDKKHFNDPGLAIADMKLSSLREFSREKFEHLNHEEHINIRS